MSSLTVERETAGMPKTSINLQKKNTMFSGYFWLQKQPLSVTL